MAQVPEEGAPQEPARTPTGQQPRKPTDQVPERDFSRMKTGPVQKPPGDKTPTRPGRKTQMLSLEPPKRRPGLAGREVRLDTFGGPRTLAQRNQTLMGKIGREKTGKIVRPPPSDGQLSLGMGKPAVKRSDTGKGMDLSGTKQSPETMMRRKATRLIPKPGGGFQGDDQPLASMESGQLAPVMQPRRPTSRQPTEPPPRVSAPIPQSPGVAFRRPDVPPPPPSARGNTLTGVSAEDLLGDEGRRVLAEMRRREAEARARGDEPYSYGGKAEPAYNDSSRQQFQGAEYGQGDSEGLEPQDFLAGPTKALSREEMQRRRDARPTAPVDTSQPPPPDDLGYEQPVNFGDAYQVAAAQAASAADTMPPSDEPVARESVAQDEMEQRAGYLMWLQGVITLEEVEEALKQAGDRASTAVTTLLMNTGFTEQITLYRFLARHESLALVDFDVIVPSKEALAALRPAIARAYRVVPFAKLGEILFVAAGFPFDPRRLLELRRLTASKVKLYVATDEGLDAALAKYYGEIPTGKLTGEGEGLQRKYDPTLTGQDSGLYAPTPTPGSLPDSNEVGQAELDYAGGGVGSDSSRADRTSPGDSVRRDAGDTLDGGALAASQRTDNGKTDEVNSPPEASDELDLNAPPSKADGGNQKDEKQDAKKDDKGSGLDSGPEDHDPFLE